MLYIEPGTFCLAAILSGVFPLYRRLLPVVTLLQGLYNKIATEASCAPRSHSTLANVIFYIGVFCLKVAKTQQNDDFKLLHVQNQGSCLLLPHAGYAPTGSCLL